MHIYKHETRKYTVRTQNSAMFILLLIGDDAGGAAAVIDIFIGAIAKTTTVSK